MELMNSMYVMSYIEGMSRIRSLNGDYWRQKRDDLKEPSGNYGAFLENR